MGKTQLAPGFRFHPTDVELVRYYLKRKVLGKKLLVDAIAEVDIYKFEPPDLPDLAFIKGGDLKWHFFVPREMKYATGVRANRATECGYWKTTGKERAVLCNDEIVGKIKTLVYHFGKSPRGERTDWVMHEYRLEDSVLKEKNIPQETYVVCVLFKKDGPGPRNGAQYGAPFREEDWSDEEGRTGVPDSNNLANINSLDVPASHGPAKDCFAGMVSESCVSDVQLTASSSMLPPPCEEANTPLSSAPVPDSNGTATQADPVPIPNPNYDDIYSMLDLFVDEDEYLRFCGANNNEVRHEPGFSAPVCLDDGIFNELPDLSNMHTNNIPRTPSYDLVENSELYLELQDLTAPLAPQMGNLDVPSSSYQGHNFGFSADPAANEDPYDIGAFMGHGPGM